MISLAGLGAAPRAYQQGLDDNLALLQKQQAQQSLTAYGNALPNVMGRPTGPAPAGGAMSPMSPSQYDSLFEQTGAKYGVPGQLLKAVAKQESGFNPQAQSPAGAQGLMQFMPPTAQQYGVDAFNPASSVDGAARYLKKLYDQFGDWKLALAGYNWGEGNVGKWLQSGADPNAMPAETRNYIANLAPVAEQSSMVQGGAGGGAGMLAPGMMSAQPMAQQGAMQPPQPGMGSPQVPGMITPQPAWARPRPQPGLSSPQVPGQPPARPQPGAGLSSPQVPGMPPQAPPMAPNRAGGQMAQPGMGGTPPAGQGQPEPPMAQLPASMAGTLDWRSLINVIQERNPGIAPEVLALTVDRFAPYMESQSAREWEQIKLQQGFDQSNMAREDQQAFQAEQSRYQPVGGDSMFDRQTGEWMQNPNAAAGGVDGKPIPAELSARIGLASEFLKPENLKFLRDGIAAGKASGPVDWASGQMGWGESGEIKRRMQSGADAMRRMLTGAGMNQNEVEEYVSRYLPSWKDDAAILSDKFEQLVKELVTIREATMLNRGLMVDMSGNVVPVGEGEAGAIAPPAADAGAAAPAAGGADVEKWLAIANQAIIDGDPPEEVIQWLRDTHGIEAALDGAN